MSVPFTEQYQPGRAIKGFFRGRIITMAIVAARISRFWFPFLMAGIVVFGMAFTFIAHAQAPTPFENAMDIAVMKGEIKELRELPAQNLSMQLKIERLDTKLQEHSIKLDEISANERWAALGIIGLFATKIFDRISFLKGGGKASNEGGDPGSGGSVRTYPNNKNR